MQMDDDSTLLDVRRGGARPLIRNPKGTIVTNWLQEQATAYRNRHDRPLSGYFTLMGVYGAATTLAAATARALGRRPPDRLDPWDVALMTVATHKLARTIAKDPITSPLRAPLPRMSEPARLPSSKRQLPTAPARRDKASSSEQLGLTRATMTAGAEMKDRTGFPIGPCWKNRISVSPGADSVRPNRFTAVASKDYLNNVYARLQQSNE